jgi:hypothetical protein
MNPLKLIFIITVLIYGALLFQRPRATTAILVVLCIVHFNWFARYMGGGAYLSRLPYFFAMLLAINLCVDLFTNRLRLSSRHDIIFLIIKFILLLVALAIISDAYNGESFILGIYELRYFFITGVLALALFYYKLLPLDITSFTRSIIFIGFLQIPFALAQYFLAGGGAERTLDSVSGTFGGYGTLVVSQVFAIGLALMYKINTGKDIIRINTYILCFLLCLPILFSNSRTAPGFILIMIVYVYLSTTANRKNLVHILKNSIVLILLVSVSAGLFYEFFWKSRNLTDQLSTSYVINYYFRDPVTSQQIYKRGATSNMGRGRSVIEAGKLISDSLPTILLGRGSGSTSHAAFLRAKGQFYQEYGPLAGISRTQYSKIIAELGIAGGFLFLFFFARIKQHINRIAHRDADLIGHTYNVFLVCIILLSIYHETFQSNFVSLLMAYLFASFQFYTKDSEMKGA